MLDRDERRKIIIKYYSEKSWTLDPLEANKKSKNSEFKTFKFEELSCGDSITFLIKKNKEFIEEIFISNHNSCIIVVSATNMIISWLSAKKRNFAQIQNLLNNLKNMIENENYNLDDCEDMKCFSNLKNISNRIKCLKLVIKSFEEMIKK